MEITNEEDVKNIEQIRFFVIWKIKQLREDELFNCVMHFKELAFLQDEEIKNKLIKIAENCIYEDLIKMVSILFPYKID